MVVWLVSPLALSHRGAFAQHILRSVPFELPRPLGPFPLTLTLSRGGERGFCPALPHWMDVPSAEAPASAGMTGVLQWSHEGRGDCWWRFMCGSGRVLVVVRFYDEGDAVDFDDLYCSSYVDVGSVGRARRPHLACRVYLTDWLERRCDRHRSSN